MKKVKVAENFATIGDQYLIARVSEYLLLSETYEVLKEKNNTIWLKELGEDYPFDKRHFVEV